MRAQREGTEGTWNRTRLFCKHARGMPSLDLFADASHQRFRHAMDHLRPLDILAVEQFLVSGPIEKAGIGLRCQM